MLERRWGQEDKFLFREHGKDMPQFSYMSVFNDVYSPSSQTQVAFSIPLPLQGRMIDVGIFTYSERPR
ncbi:hypothetical protein [Xanthobacter sp. YC-JY1]|uniref:hypothetical protein n=1 Tax=Xanthobacter sp. YC-JY1 TaxID=2419844 RepID=UPI001F3BA16C|nr:hypothetical protein [Xanthobacter sp. YC-JY1]